MVNLTQFRPISTPNDTMLYDPCSNSKVRLSLGKLELCSLIETLVKVCKHSYQQAEQCAYIVHFSGKCVVKTGSLEKLIPICTALLEAGLSVEIT